jgi:hypothetical protein
VRLIGYTLTPEGYRVLAPDDQGRLWLAPVRVWLGVRDGEIICYDESGRPLGDHLALARALQEEEQARREAEARAMEAETRATAEQRARAAAEARVRELEEALRRTQQNL